MNASVQSERIHEHTKQISTLEGKLEALPRIEKAIDEIRKEIKDQREKRAEDIKKLELKQTKLSMKLTGLFVGIGAILTVINTAPRWINLFN